MNPRYQDGSFQTAADMLRNQQRDFVEPLTQQMSANLGETLAASISFAVGQEVQAAQNRDVRPRREQDHGTMQHRNFADLVPGSSDSPAQVPQGSRGSHGQALYTTSHCWEVRRAVAKTAVTLRPPV